MFAARNLEHRNDYDDTDDDGSSAWLRCGGEGRPAWERRLRHNRNATADLDNDDAEHNHDTVNEHDRDNNVDHGHHHDDYDGAYYDHNTHTAVFGAAVWPDAT